MTHDKNDWLLSLILDQINKSNKIVDSESVDKVAQKIVSTIIPQCTDFMLKYVKSNLEDILNKKRTYARQFEERLLQRWKKPINLLEVLVELCVEAGGELNNEYRSVAAKSNDYVFDVLTRLHARGCQVGHEILVLLKAGLADGAQARWRTLHEITVVACFIKKEGREVAKRYLYYEIVEAYKALPRYQQHCLRLGYTPFTEKEVATIRKHLEKIVGMYGKDFKNEYGWASKCIPNPTFAALEKRVKLDHLHPYYTMACHNIHSGPKGIKSRLGLPKIGSNKDTLLAGPSNYGLADPGQCAAISLSQITTCLLSTRPTIKRVSTMKTIQELVKEMNPAFVEIQMQIEKEEKPLDSQSQWNAGKQ